MKLSRRSFGLVIAVVALLTISLISAGCVGSVSVFPNEVNSHGNIIYVDSNYISSATIAEMLLNPDNYQQQLFETVNAYLPKNQPVVEIGVGPGAVMAFISKKLSVPKQHVAIDANPYLITNLKQTINKNSLVVDLQNAAIAYGQDNFYVPVIITTDSGDIVTSIETTETVDVPATTITKLIEESTFDTCTNVTLVVETTGLLESIFKNDGGLYTHVDLIIGTVPELSDVQAETFRNLAFEAGYDIEFVSYSYESGISAYVLKRIEKNST